jgi:DNA-binding transcriptional LysR family regulator
MTEALLTESRERPAGRLKVTTTTGFGSTWLAPRLRRFLAMHPDVTVTLLLDDSDLDLAMREADVAIRMHPPRQPDLIQRHVATFGWRVCGSAEYLKQHGMPQRAEELDAHRLIIYGDYRPPVENINWLVEAGRRAGSPRRATLELNSLPGMLSAVRSGLGLAALPDYMGDELADLVQVLPEMKTPRIEAYFVYPEELRHSKRVAVFRDFLVAELALPARANAAA